MAARRCLVVIGNSKYSFAPLNHPEPDAKEIVNIFAAFGYRVFSRYNVETDDAMNELVEVLKASVDEHTEIIVVFFTGHAVTNSCGRVRLLHTNAASAKDAEPRTGTFVDDILSQLLGLRSSEHALVASFVDVCRSHLNPSACDRSSQPPRPRRFLQRQTATIWACATAATASDGETSDGHSPFAKSLIRLLREEVDRSIPELYEALNKDVASYAKNRTAGLVSQSVYLSQQGHLLNLRGLFVKPGTLSSHQTVPVVPSEMSTSASELDSSTVDVTELPSDRITIFSADSANVAGRCRQAWCCNLRWPAIVGVIAVSGIALVGAVWATCEWTSPSTGSETQDCVLGGWIEEQPCSASCGGGSFVFRRDVLRDAIHGGRCPGPNDGSRTMTGSCNMHSCPAGCCSVCDLQCSGQVCKILLDFRRDPDEDFACAISTTWTVTWDSDVAGRFVEWKFDLTGPPLRTIRRKMVLTGYLPDDEAIRQWDEMTRHSLTAFANQFGMNVTRAEAVSVQASGVVSSWNRDPASPGDELGTRS